MSDPYDVSSLTSGWYEGCGVTKKEYKANALHWHFARWCMARGVLRGGTNAMPVEDAMELDRAEARFFARYLKLNLDELAYV